MKIPKDSTSVTITFKLVDPAAGTPETGLTITNLDLTYCRNRATAVKADLTALAAVNSIWDDNNAKEIDGTNMPGLYRVDVPNAAFATGVDRVDLCVNGAAIDPAYLNVELTDNVVASVSGSVGSVTGAVGSVTGAVGSVTGSVGSVTGHTNQSGDSYAIVNSGTYGNAKLVRSTVPANALDVSATGEAGLDFDNIKAASGATTLTNITVPTVTNVGTVTGNVDGSVGSVTGAVGSVTTAVTVGTISSGVIAAATFAANAINAAALAADAATQIRDAVTGGAYALDTDANGRVRIVDGTSAGELDTNAGLVKLASDGLDSISTTAPSGVASNFREMLVQVWRRFFKKSTLTSTQLKTYADNGSDILTTQTVSDDGTTQTQGVSS